MSVEFIFVGGLLAVLIIASVVTAIVEISTHDDFYDIDPETYCYFRNL